jgi:Fur family zinc uptake transcriptional regulator
MNAPTSGSNIKQSPVVEIARRICGDKGLRLTELRAAALEEVAEYGPISAYQLLARLSTRLGRRVDPPTVYRALAFLMNADLINRLETINAYVVRRRPERMRASVILLCKECESMVELEDPAVLGLIEGDAAALGFRLGGPLIECSGTCKRCATNKDGTP